MTLGEPSFFPTIEAHTDAPIIGGNRVDILLNGDETFPPMLRDIKGATRTITFAQYLYEDGSIAYELAQAFAERCRAGVVVNILLDSHGTNTPAEIPDMMRDAGCQVELFRRVEGAAGDLLLEVAAIQLSQPSPYSRDRWTDRVHRRVWNQ
jgi:cardiolipin synthase